MTAVSRSAPARPAEKIAVAKLWWVGLLALAASLVANGLVRVLALAVLPIDPAFDPLQSQAFIGLTTVFTILAVAAYWIVGRVSRQPITTYRRVSVVALLLSLIPDLGLLFAGAPGVTIPAILALMLMHVVSAAIIVGLLTTLARE
jgi:hypothetical protein